MNRQQYAYNILLFLISPILAFFVGIRKFGVRYSKSILIIFFGIYGSVMIFDPGKDGYRHSTNITNHYVDLDFAEFWEEAKDIMLFQPQAETNDDIFLHLISYLVAFFSESSSGLYLVVGLIYGYFFVSGIEKVYRMVKNQWTFVIILLFLLFVSWKSFEGINSIRNYTAAWIYFNGAFSYFQTRNRKYIGLVLLAPFVHFAYGLMIIPFLIVTVLGNYPKIFFAIMLASYFVDIDLSFFEQLATSTQLGASKFQGYALEGSYTFERTKASSFHIVYYLPAIRIFLQIIFIYSILFFGYLRGKKHDKFMTSTASLAMLLLAFSNFSTFIPVLQSRLITNFGFYAIVYIISLYTLQLRYHNHNTIRSYGFRSIVGLGVPVIGLFVFTQYSLIGEFTDFRVLASPLMYPFIGDEALSIKQLIKDIFI